MKSGQKFKGTQAEIEEKYMFDRDISRQLNEACNSFKAHLDDYDSLEMLSRKCNKYIQLTAIVNIDKAT